MLPSNLKNVLGSFLRPNPKSTLLTRIALWCLVWLTIMAAAGGWTVFYFVPYSHAFGDAERDLADVETQLARARQNATALKESPKDLSIPALHLGRDLYRNFIAQIGPMSKNQGVQLTDATPKPVISSPPGADRFPYSTATFGIKFEGTKENILAFLDQIQREWPYASITKLDLRPTTATNSPPGTWLLESKIGFLIEPQSNR